MKTIIYIFISTLFANSICNSQISYDYPFKTYLDSLNNLYVTGFRQIGNTKDIYIAKYPPNPGADPIWYYEVVNPTGDDRGLDLAVDRFGNTFVTGYIFNNITNSNDIIVIAFHSDGIFNWSKTYNNIGDDSGMGIEISKGQNGTAEDIYITGYVTTPANHKDFIIKKYSADNGDSLGQTIYSVKLGDDIATDILLDGDFVHVMGYAYFGPVRKNDLTLLTFWNSNLSLQEALFNNSPIDEKPTEFVIAERSYIPVQKSKISLTSVTDNSNGTGGSVFRTMLLEPSHNNMFNIRWTREFVNCISCRNEYATSVGQDFSGDIYIAGYVWNLESRNRGLDFATIKYKLADGAYGWEDRLKLFNYSDTSQTGIHDKASSIKINNTKTIYVAGVSEASPSGFSYVQYSQSTGDPVYELDRVFIPNFIANDRTQGVDMNKWATVHLADDGTPLVVVMGWNETSVHWSAIRYDANGNILYTINNESGETDKSVQTNFKTSEITLSNSPNPFNPSTNISYSIIQNGYVSLKVYNSLGKEVASLVNERQNPGSHSVIFNASSLSSGVYYYIMSINGIVRQMQRMVFLK